MKTKIRSLIVLIIIASFDLPLVAQSIDHQLARQYFKEAKTQSDLDGGKLWGIQLYGPLVFVDQSTREGVANSPVPVEGWSEDHGLYYGKMAENMGFANTAFDWNGEKWSMIIFDHLSSDPQSRASLMMHELLHQHEQKLGIVTPYDQAKHLDKKMARVSIFLEWNALLNACQSNGQMRKIAIQDALSFRRYRFGLYPQAKSNETGKELHEGAAEYTGMALSGWDDEGKIKFLQNKVSDRSSTKTMVWTFAYVAGPLYGYLLDQESPGWTRWLKAGDDLGDLLSNAYQVPYHNISESDLSKLGIPYGYDSILAFESDREAEALALQEKYKRIFTEEPVLFLPKESLQIQFDPRQITPFEKVGTVYGTLTANDKWGKLEITNGYALLLDGWKGISIPVGKSWKPEMGLEGQNWKLELKKGYTIVRNEKGWILLPSDE